jgi:hypothetical protein
VPLKRTLALIILNATLAATATAALVIQFAWRGEPWATYTRLCLWAACVVSLISLYLLKDPGFALFRSLSPNWRRTAVGISIILCALPWTLIIGLGVRYRLLPNSAATGLLLLIPFAALVITGLYFVIIGYFERR